MIKTYCLSLVNYLDNYRRFRHVALQHFVRCQSVPLNRGVLLMLVVMSFACMSDCQNKIFFFGEECSILEEPAAIDPTFVYGLSRKMNPNYTQKILH